MMVLKKERKNARHTPTLLKYYRRERFERVVQGKSIKSK